MDGNDGGDNGAEYRCLITDANGDMGSTRIATIKLDILDWEMEYNTSGIRTKRSSEEKTYNYIYAGDKLMRMTVGNDVLDFSYDTNGVPLTMTYNGTVYYYITNLQGDVIKMERADGSTGASYAYDAWGNILRMSGTLAELNPLRYRGYVYDQETGFYYLNSRYYDPAVGRFINADSYVSTGDGFTGLNMFAYCNNNPANRIDPDGHDSYVWEWLTTMWWLCLVDGPYPIADAIYVVGAVGILVIDHVITSSNSQRAMLEVEEYIANTDAKSTILESKESKDTKKKKNEKRKHSIFNTFDCLWQKNQKFFLTRKIFGDRVK